MSDYYYIKLNMYEIQSIITYTARGLLSSHSQVEPAILFTVFELRFQKVFY